MLVHDSGWFQMGFRWNPHLVCEHCGVPLMKRYITTTDAEGRATLRILYRHGLEGGAVMQFDPDNPEQRLGAWHRRLHVPGDQEVPAVPGQEDGGL